MQRSKLEVSSPVFCVSFLPNPSQVPLRWFTLKWHHVNITSPNPAVGKENFKAKSGTRGFAQSCGASSQRVFLQDSSKLCPSNLHTCRPPQLAGDDFPVFGSQSFVLRGVWIDCSTEICFLLGARENLTWSWGFSSRKNLLQKLLMTNHKGHVAHQWFDFQNMLFHLQDCFALIGQTKNSIFVITTNMSRFPTSTVISYHFKSHFGLPCFLDTFIICKHT